MIDLHEFVQVQYYGIAQTRVDQSSKLIKLIIFLTLADILNDFSTCTQFPIIQTRHELDCVKHKSG
jgi:hypothetical protein